MDAKTNKQLKFIINIAYIAIIVGLAYVFFKYLFWVLAPFIIAFFIAVVLQKPIRKLDKKTGKKMHTFWSILMLVIVALIIIGPIGILLTTIINKISEFASYLMSEMNDIPSFLAKLENILLDRVKILPDKLEPTVVGYIRDTFGKMLNGGNFNLTEIIDSGTIKEGISSGVSGIFSVVKNIPSILVSTIISIISCVLFTIDYDLIVRFIQKQLPDDKKNILVDFKKLFNKTIGTLFKAYGLIMCITFLELFLGFSILTLLGIMDNGYYILIAAATAIFDILPVAGSGGVLLPWALIELIDGNTPLAIGLVVVLVVISIIREYLEPKVVGTSLGVHPLVTLMGLYIGLKMFGFIGMLIVPLTVMTLKALNDNGRLKLWQYDKTPEPKEEDTKKKKGLFAKIKK